MPIDDKADSQFELKILRAAVVEAEIDAFIRRLKETPDKITPIEVLAAIRKWMAAAEWQDAWVRLTQDWQNAVEQETEKGERYPIMEYSGEQHVVGPMNPSWADMFIRILTSQSSEKFDTFDVTSQLGAMGKPPQAQRKSGGISARRWYTRKK